MLQLPPKRIRAQVPDQYRHLDQANTSAMNPMSLPDDLVDYIFSFLPIQDAAQIGTVSTRFKKSWIFSRKLHFGREFARGRNNLESYGPIIDKIFNVHVGPIESFRLYFDPTGDESLVLKWIKICVEKGVEELDLEFFRGEPFQLSSDIFNVESLRILKLNYCQIELPPKLTGLSLLNTLVFRRLDITLRFMDILLFNCLSLETLELVSCYTISFLTINAQNLTKFKVLRVGSCPDLFRIHIHAPSLLSFYYTGNIRFLRFVGVPKLNDVILDFVPSRGMEAFPVRNLVYDLSHVYVLSTSSTFLEGLCARFIQGTIRETQFLFWNLRELQLFMAGATFCNLFDIVNFLKNCPCLETIFIDLSEFSFEYGYYWELHQRKLVEHSRLSFNCLNFIKVKGFRFQTYELMLVRFLLERSIHLKQLALVSPKPTRNKALPPPDLAFHTQLFNSWKVSRMAQINIYGYNKDKSSFSPMHLKSWY